MTAPLGELRDLGILIVDDDPAAIQLLRAMLSEYRNIRVATSGPHALSLARAQVPDLILLDGEMPGQSGFEVCMLCKADERLRHVPIIFVTAHDDLELETRALTLGAADFLPKPFSAARVRLRVKLHLELKRQVDTLRLLAATDDLTQLANRRAVDETLAAEVGRARRTGLPLSLLLIDIDHFKPFNDEYGHPAGDDCLRQVAGVIREVARRPTDLAARFGGEEFAIVLPHTPPEGALEVARSLHDRLASAAIGHRASPIADRITASIGVAALADGRARLDPDSPRSADESTAQVQQLLVEAADRALYAAKRGGRNRTSLALLDVAARRSG